MSTQHFFRTFFAVFVSILVLTSWPVPVEGALSLYLDDAPAPSDIAVGVSFPTLGIHSDSLNPWHGYVKSTYFHLINGQVNESLFYLGDLTITPYNEPFGYEMTADVTLISQCVLFTMDIYSEDAGQGYITLWNDASLFDVPVDTLSIYRGGPPGFENSDVDADAGGPYQLFEDGSVMFDATDSTYTLWFEDGTSSTGSMSLDRSLPYWSINGVDIAFGLTPTISYDTLVNGLNLTPGIYDLNFELDSCFGYDTAMTTIEIIPEPTAITLFAFGMLFLKKRNNS